MGDGPGENAETPRLAAWLCWLWVFWAFSASASGQPTRPGLRGDTFPVRAEAQRDSESQREREPQSLSRGATRFSEVPLWSSQGLSDRVPQQAAHGAAEP